MKILIVPGIEVPKAIKLIALRVSLKPTEQPKWEATSPTIAVSNPIRLSDPINETHPLNNAFRVELIKLEYANQQEKMGMNV